MISETADERKTRADEILHQRERLIYRRIDRMFAVLMVVQWVGAVDGLLHSAPDLVGSNVEPSSSRLVRLLGRRRLGVAAHLAGLAAAWRRGHSLHDRCSSDDFFVVARASERRPLGNPFSRLWVARLPGGVSRLGRPHGRHDSRRRRPPYPRDLLAAVGVRRCYRRRVAVGRTHRLGAV